MINKAIAKITQEMMKDRSRHIQHIEEHLTSICTNEKVANKLLAPEKTLKGAFQAMKSEAQKNAKGGAACMTDEEAWEIVEKYFDITSEDKDPGEKTIVKKDILSMI